MPRRLDGPRRSLRAGPWTVVEVSRRRSRRPGRPIAASGLVSHIDRGGGSLAPMSLMYWETPNPRAAADDRDEYPWSAMYRATRTTGARGPVPSDATAMNGVPRTRTGVASDCAAVSSVGATAATLPQCRHGGESVPVGCDGHSSGSIGTWVRNPWQISPWTVAHRSLSKGGDTHLPGSDRRYGNPPFRPERGWRDGSG
jgi:hypothetical protein